MWMAWRRLCSHCPSETNNKIPDPFSLKRFFWARPKIAFCLFARLKLSCCWFLKMKVRRVFLVFPCGLCTDIRSVSVSRLPMLFFHNVHLLLVGYTMFFLSFLQVFGISDERRGSNVHYCYKSDIFTFSGISFSLPVSQSQAKQPHLLLPFLLLTALLSSPCGRAFPGSAVPQLRGTVSLSVPVTRASSFASSPGCVAPTLPFPTVAVSACSEASPLQGKEQPDVCTVTATFFKTCWREQGPWVG